MARMPTGLLDQNAQSAPHGFAVEAGLLGYQQGLQRLQPLVARALGEAAIVEVQPMKSQIGSGALPVESLASAGLTVRPVNRSGTMLKRLETAFRHLPVPVIGHVADGALHFDLRCLEDEASFVSQLHALGRP